MKRASEPRQPISTMRPSLRRPATDVAARRVLAALALVAALWTGACKREPPVAHVTQVQGKVTLKKGNAGEPLEALQGNLLHDGDLVATAAASTAIIEFEGGNRIELEPNTTLVVKRGGGTAAQFGAVIIEGLARATSGRKGVLLSIGTPQGISTQIGRDELVIELDLNRGITVVIGEVQIETADGKLTTVAAGHVMQLDGLVVPLDGKPEPDPQDAELNLEPMSFVLIANPKQVQVRRSGSTAWVTPKKRDVLGAGDAVRTRKGSGTALSLGDATTVALSTNTELTLVKAAANDKAQRADYELTGGNAAVLLKRGAQTESTHAIRVAGTVVTVGVGETAADVEVNTNGSDAATVAVRLGKATLADGTLVEAGTRVSIANGKVTEAARPVASTDVTVSPGRNTVIFYQSDVPPVELGWQAEDKAEQYELELASDSKFEKPIFRERLKKNKLAYDRLGAGQYYWRVRGAGDWTRGAFALQRGGDNDCANCKRVNVIHDTGEKTVVYFQRALPAITLAWKETPGASSYRVKVFKDGEFENAMADEATDKREVAFTAGRFEEGKYFWLVMAYDGDKKELRTGGTNGLEIAYDNAITDIVIKAPRPNEKVRGNKLTTHGEVQLGARLSVNGRSVQVDGKGRFKETLTLNPGRNRLVYRTVTGDGAERYYLREIVAR